MSESDHAMWPLPMGKRAQIRVELWHWSGSHRLNVRLSVERQGGMIATRSGLTVPLDQASGLANAVSAAVLAARDSGLID